MRAVDAMGDLEKSQRLRTANVRIAVVLALLALAVYVGFILMNG